MSTDDRDAIIEEALGLDRKTRNQFLDKACAGRPELRREVNLLLEIDARDEASFLDRSCEAKAVRRHVLLLAGMSEDRHLAANDSSEGSAFASLLDAPLLEPGTVLGQYRVDAFIGAGGMGQVFRATDMKLGRQVALKILPRALAHDPGRVGRFLREAQLLAALNHPYIAQIYGLETIDGVTALVMEMVDVDFRLATDHLIAVARNVPELRTSDIYVLDKTRRTERRLTTHPALDASPVWSPDTTHVAFRSKRRNGATDNPSDPYEVSTDGSTEPRLLLSTPEGKYPTDWSPDGRSVAYHTPSTRTGWDIWILSLGEDPSPTALVATEANEMEAKFSPNGRWIAYTSDESGRPEVYVKSYPTDRRSWRVSAGGGSQPLWTRDGRELLFVASDGTLMAASIATRSQFRVRGIRPQFRIPAPGFGPPFSPNYAVSTDGKRVLVNALRRDSLPTVEVLLNWPVQLVAR